MNQTPRRSQECKSFLDSKTKPFRFKKRRFVSDHDDLLEHSQCVEDKKPIKYVSSLFRQAARIRARDRQCPQCRFREQDFYLTLPYDSDDVKFKMIQDTDCNHWWPEALKIRKQQENVSSSSNSSVEMTSDSAETATIRPRLKLPPSTFIARHSKFEYPWIKLFTIYVTFFDEIRTCVDLLSEKIISSVASLTPDEKDHLSSKLAPILLGWFMDPNW